MRRYRCAIILCDEGWVDPDLDTSNGIQIESEGDLLRLDSMLLMVQLNVRSILEVIAHDAFQILWSEIEESGKPMFLRKRGFKEEEDERCW